MIDGREYVFEKPLHGDFAFVRAYRGDRLGNLNYRMAMRNFKSDGDGGKFVAAEVDELVPVEDPRSGRYSHAGDLC